MRREIDRGQEEFARAFARRVELSGPFGWQVLKGVFLTQVVRPGLEMAAFALAAIGLALGWVDLYTALLVLLATVGMGIVLSMASVVLREVAEPSSPDERRMAAMFFAAIPENLGFNQARNIWLLTRFRRASVSPVQTATPAVVNPPAVPEGAGQERSA